MSEHIAHVDYKQVEKIHGDNARNVYREIAEIAGGDPNPNHEGGMSLAGLPESKIAKIEKLLAKPENEKLVETGKTKSDPVKADKK